MSKSFTTYVQAVPERLAVVQTYRKEFPDLRIHIDAGKTGSHKSFGKMLEYEHPGWRLHLQDDLVIAPGLCAYIPQIIETATTNEWDMVSLFCMKRKLPGVQYKQWTWEDTWMKQYKLFHILAVLLSPKALAALRESYWNVSAIDLHTPNGQHDDMAVQEVIEKHKLVAVEHYPSLVQHQYKLPSSMNHPITSFTRSGIYDPSFLQ